LENRLKAKEDDHRKIESEKKTLMNIKEKQEKFIKQH